jgi:hypothetical protein
MPEDFPESLLAQEIFSTLAVPEEAVDFSKEN